MSIIVKNMKTSELIAFYNANSGKKAIKKFRDRATAEARVQELLPHPAVAELKGKRASQVVEILKGGKVTVKELMKHFDTEYKNVTGDLFVIRKAGIPLKKERMPSGEYAFSLAMAS